MAQKGAFQHPSNPMKTGRRVRRPEIAHKEWVQNTVAATECLRFLLTALPLWVYFKSFASATVIPWGEQRKE